MRLEKASYAAVKWACIKYHYAKRVPSQPMTAFSVFNENEEWCGCIVFNIGIGNISKPFKLPNGSVCELVRVALNGKHGVTSKAVALAVKLFKKLNPLCKVLVSYADSDEQHNGTIYQAMNWLYLGAGNTGAKYIDRLTGKSIYSRSHSPTGYKIQFGSKKKVRKTGELQKIETGVKHKYCYPLCASLLPTLRAISKPYPKSSHAQIAHKGERHVSNVEGAFDSTVALKSSNQ